MEVKTLSIDLAKDIFQVYGLDAAERVVIDRKVGRARLLNFIGSLAPAAIFMEACGGAHYWAKKFIEIGHTVKLIAPHHVTPYVGRQKNDRNDAKAILEACKRPEAVFVGIKKKHQQDIQSLHRARDIKLKHQIALINQIRGLMLEYGVTIPKSHSRFKEHIEERLEDAENELSDVVRSLCWMAYSDYKRLSEQIKELEVSLKKESKNHEFISRAQEELKGVGPLIASKFFASIGDVNAFSNGRQVSAWLGVVPRQFSAGGKPRLGRITKHGDADLRQLVVQGARAAVMAAKLKAHPNEEEIKVRIMAEKKGFNLTSVAVANRNIRRMYAILKKCEDCAS